MDQDLDGTPQRRKQGRPNWLPPGWLVLTGGTGMPCYIRASGVQAVDEPPTDGGGFAAVVFVEHVGPCRVIESPEEVMHQLSRVTA